MSDYPYKFDANINKTLVYLPKHIVSQLDFGKSKRLRIDGEITAFGSKQRGLTQYCSARELQFLKMDFEITGNVKLDRPNQP